MAHSRLKELHESNNGARAGANGLLGTVASSVSGADVPSGAPLRPPVDGRPSLPGLDPL